MVVSLLLQSEQLLAQPCCLYVCESGHQPGSPGTSPSDLLPHLGLAFVLPCLTCLAPLPLCALLLPLSQSSPLALNSLCLPIESQLALNLSLQYVFDYQQGDVFGCVADIGWITGHSYVVYGPLCNGATSVLFESTPVYPDPGEEVVGKGSARHGSVTKEI